MENTKCPVCGQTGSVEVRPKSFSCSSDGCEFVLWKDGLRRFGQDEITEDQAAALINGEQIQLKNLTSKSGNKFDCRGELDKWTGDDGQTRYSVKLIFSEKKATTTEEDLPL
jgi:hypothetical protein